MHTDLIKQKSNSALEITSKKTIKLELQTNWHYFLKIGHQTLVCFLQRVECL